jgi:hypothetical protein
VTGAFLQHVFKAGEKDRHGHEVRPVDPAQQAGVGLVDPQQHGAGRGDGQAGKDIDEEQPAPVQRVGDQSARRRAKRRRQDADGAEDGRISARCLPENSVKPTANTSGTIAPPVKPCKGAEGDNRSDRPRQAAQQAGNREHGARSHEQPARRQCPREEAGQRNHHQFGHQVGGLHPADFIRPGGEPAATSRCEAETIWMSNRARNCPNAINPKIRNLRAVGMAVGSSDQSVPKRAKDHLGMVAIFPLDE